jgi:hypothetical protein
MQRAALWDDPLVVYWAVKTAARTAALSVVWKAAQLADDSVEPSDCLRSDGCSVAAMAVQMAVPTVVQKVHGRAEKWACR